MGGSSLQPGKAWRPILTFAVRWSGLLATRPTHPFPIPSSKPCISPPLPRLTDHLPPLPKLRSVSKTGHQDAARWPWKTADFWDGKSWELIVPVTTSRASVLYNSEIELAGNLKGVHFLIFKTASPRIFCLPSINGPFSLSPFQWHCLYLSILVGFLLNLLPFLFLFSLLIHLFPSAHSFAIYIFFKPGVWLCPTIPTPSPPPPMRSGSHLYGHHQPSIPCSTFLTPFPFRFVSKPSLPSFPWQMFKTKLLICLSSLSLSVLLSLLPSAPGFLKVCLRIYIMSLFIPITNASFTVLNKWCFSAPGELVSPLKTLYSENQINLSATFLEPILHSPSRIPNMWHHAYLEPDFWRDALRHPQLLDEFFHQMWL